MGEFRYKHFSAPDRRGRRRLKGRGRVQNGITTGGLNDLLNATFGASAQRPAWYVGLVDSAGFTGFSPSDTMASHPGWSEVANYTGGQPHGNATRPQWLPGPPSAGTIANSAMLYFRFPAPTPYTVQGLFVASDNTIGGTSGVLWSTASFDTPAVMEPYDLLVADYTLTVAAGVGS